MSRFKFCVSAILSLAAMAHGREFRNKDGRVIEGEIRSVRGDQVEMNVRDKLFVFPIESLSEADQSFVREWAAQNRTVALDIRARASEDPSRRLTEGGSKDKSVSRHWRYEVALTNRSGEDLGDLEVKYNIVVRHTGKSNELLAGKRKEERMEIIAGTSRIPGVANTASASFASEWQALKSREWEVSKSRTIYGSDGSRDVEHYWDDYSSESELDGIWVKVFEKGRQICEWKSDGKLIKEAQWNDQSTGGKTIGLPRG